MSIRETLKSIPVDKAFHFIGGWALVATLYPYFPVFSFIAVIAVAAWKEWDDGNGHGTRDFWDFLVTVAGGVCAALAHGFLGLF
jgi:hypothetical protein